MSVNINSVTIGGNLTRDIDLRYTAGGKAVGNTSVAINRSFGKGDDRKEEVTFVEVTLWGRDAENAAAYLSKGSSVVIEGRLTSESWDDRETGKKRSRMIVTAERVHYAGDGSKAGYSRQDERGRRDAAPSTRRRIDDADVPSPGDGGGNDESDEIPF